MLGTFDENPTNEFVARNGTLVPVDSNLERIHHDFGMTWQIDESQSFFQYFGSKNYSFYNDHPNFRPVFNFDPEEASPEARSVCADDWACLYDYESTGDPKIANNTREFNEVDQIFTNKILG